jgi:hypothetical protein
MEASSSTSAPANPPVQEGSSHSVNGTNGTDGPSKPRARLGPVETVTLQEFDPDSDSEDEEEEEAGEAHIEEIEAQSEDFLKDHPDDTDVCYSIKRRVDEFRIYIFNIFDLRILPFLPSNYLDSSNFNDYV